MPNLTANDIGTVSAFVAALGGMLGGAIKFLDGRRAKDREEGDARIAKLESRIAKLENEHLAGRRHIVEAINLCPKGPEYTRLSEHLLAAADALS